MIQTFKIKYLYIPTWFNITIALQPIQLLLLFNIDFKTTEAGFKLKFIYNIYSLLQTWNIKLLHPMFGYFIYTYGLLSLGRKLVEIKELVSQTVIFWYFWTNNPIIRHKYVNYWKSNKERLYSYFPWTSKMKSVLGS